MCATTEIWEACWHVSRPELHARSRDVSRVTEVWISTVEFNVKSPVTSQLYALTLHELTWREDSVSPAIHFIGISRSYRVSIRRTHIDGGEIKFFPLGSSVNSRTNTVKADSHIACRSPVMPCINSHMPCRAPALFQQCRVLRESPRGSRKYPNC
jgi:hypothetical protein